MVARERESCRSVKWMFFLFFSRWCNKKCIHSHKQRTVFIFIRLKRTVLSSRWWPSITPRANWYSKLVRTNPKKSRRQWPVFFEPVQCPNRTSSSSNINFNRQPISEHFRPSLRSAKYRFNVKRWVVFSFRSIRWRIIVSSRSISGISITRSNCWMNINMSSPDKITMNYLINCPYGPSRMSPRTVDCAFVSISSRDISTRC